MLTTGRVQRAFDSSDPIPPQRGGGKRSRGRAVRRGTGVIAVCTGIVATASSLSAPAFADGCVLVDGRLHCSDEGSRHTGGHGSRGGGGGGGGPFKIPIDGGDWNLHTDPGQQVTTKVPAIDFAQRLRVETEFPVPTVYTAPADRTFVATPTALWVDGYRTVSTRVIRANNRRIQAVATPVSVTWDLGEGQIKCANAGTPDGKSCSYTYQRSSARAPGGVYEITATITWSVGWTCRGKGCEIAGGSLDDQVMTSLPYRLKVDEIQSGNK